MSATFALGASLASTDAGQAQGLLRATPPAPAEDAGRLGKPKYDDIKVQTGTALPPKSGAMIVLNRTWQKQLLTLTPDGRWTARRTRP
jgi:hypothetical protein